MAEKKNVSRRDFLKTSGIAAGALVGGGIIGGVIGANTRQDTAAPSWRFRWPKRRGRSD